MAMNVTPFVGTDNFNMETFNNMISQINSGVNGEISDVLAQLGTRAKIQTGSYVGTGTYGADNPCSLTFDFEPKICVVYRYSGLQVGSGGSGWGIPSFLWLSRQTSAKISEGSGTSASTLHLEQNGNTLSWYATAAAGGVTLQNTQCNASGVTYYWLAI